MEDIYKKYNKLIQYTNTTYKLILNMNTQMYIYKKQNKLFVSDLTISDISQDHIIHAKQANKKRKRSSKYLSLILGNMIEIIYLIL